MELIGREIDILRNLDHPNISQFYSKCESEQNLYLLMEYCAGTNLQDEIIKNKEVFSEQIAKNIMKCLFKAINHCHHL